MEEHFRNVENIAIRRETIARYVDLLINAKILYKCERFDLKSRKSLRGDENTTWPIRAYISRATPMRASITAQRWKTCCSST